MMQRIRQWGKCLVILGLIAILGLGSAACGEKPARKGDRPSTRLNSPRPSSISEVPPPALLQDLRPFLENYQPQVKILSPRPDEVLQDDKVSVKVQVNDLPIFKDKTLGLGPHVHVILDNSPYKALYDAAEPIVFENLEPGTHTVRAIASRPWHELFKNDGAFAQVTFHVYAKTPDNRPIRNQPLLTYSRPVGSYGAEPVMLDFFLTNVPLHIIAQSSEDDDIPDWRIRATVNGESFLIDQWQPIYLKGLKPGKNWVQLELLNEDGEPIPNAFNNTVRVITYEPGGTDPLAKLVRGDLTLDEARAIVDPNYKPAPKPLPAPIVKESPAPTPAMPPVQESPAPAPAPVPAPVPAPAKPAPSPTPAPESEPPKAAEPKATPPKAASPRKSDSSVPEPAVSPAPKAIAPEPSPSPRQSSPVVESAPTPVPTPVLAPTPAAEPSPVPVRPARFPQGSLRESPKAKKAQETVPASPTPVAPPAATPSPQPNQPEPVKEPVKELGEPKPSSREPSDLEPSGKTPAPTPAKAPPPTRATEPAPRVSPVSAVPTPEPSVIPEPLPSPPAQPAPTPSVLRELEEQVQEQVQELPAPSPTPRVSRPARPKPKSYLDSLRDRLKEFQSSASTKVEALQESLQSGAKDLQESLQSGVKELQELLD
ncbi:hypothetical protein [Thermoleptolyngbya sp. C42_A2020_037]|uniref:hypothetical protein n=1 Tax=Thermoleptolyngbya sp. C42_A2020_037 TaxID=2747799 RepID=UPI001A07AD71|nr:hypothetical protein [Thermoleptolyngbya sp. C42_A2020_037]MBF2083918.1 hypothetical protein [Thermoleptolyngbya sp. C42_A2020_037]